jgi:hypothetical protein
MIIAWFCNRQKFIQDQLAVRHGKTVDDVKKPDEQKESKELFHLPDFLNVR